MGSERREREGENGEGASTLNLEPLNGTEPGRHVSCAKALLGRPEASDPLLRKSWDAKVGLSKLRSRFGGGSRSGNRSLARG